MTIIAEAAAPAALDWLANTSMAQVLNVFDRACNLVNPAGEVLALVIGERAMTPFGLLLRQSTPGLLSFISATSPVRVERERLTIGTHALRWMAARAWNPTPDWAALRVFFSSGPRAAELAAAAAAAGFRSRGSLLEVFEPAPATSALPAPLTVRFRRGASALVEGLRSATGEMAAAGARDLAGLGGGLTPAGDDFIVGALLAAWAGLFGPGREGLASDVANTAAARTTTLSGAYLKAAARGQCAAPWHGLFSALLAGAPADTRRALAALLAVGHTSGGDALAGFLAAHYLAASWAAPEPATSQVAHADAD